MILLLTAGLLLLVLGAEALVRGASRLALKAGLSPLVVGLTVVAFGTSAPELAVSIGSSLSGQSALALGNVVGSNVFNVLFILGLSALAAPLVAHRQLVRLDVPIGIAVSGAVLALALDGRIGRIDGLLLTVGLAAYTGLQLRLATSTAPDASSESAAPAVPTASGKLTADRTALSEHGLVSVGLVVGGLALLVLGAQWFVEGAVTAARLLGLSELAIGLTIVAGGTSLPELATSVLASLRGQRDIAVGNVVGSNVFNLLGVLGLSAVVAPEGLAVSETALWFDLPVMIAAAVACLPIFYTGHRIERWEGVLFLGYYAAYVAYLLLAATQHEALSTFSLATGAFVLPLTAITLVILAVRAWRTNANDPT
jgi:cation:H+ antiporter